MNILQKKQHQLYTPGTTTADDQTPGKRSKHRTTPTETAAANSTDSSEERRGRSTPETDIKRNKHVEHAQIATLATHKLARHYLPGTTTADEHSKHQASAASTGQQPQKLRQPTARTAAKNAGAEAHLKQTSNVKNM